jgi:DNA-binding XRE family transcriptional regulator
MARNFNELRAKMSPESRARVEERVKQAIKDMPLDELRDARELTQAQLAQVLQVSQGAVSKVERRTDMYISTLRSYISAMGSPGSASTVRFNCPQAAKISLPLGRRVNVGIPPSISIR